MAMKAFLAAAFSLAFSGAAAVADPAFSTGGPCPVDAASRVPAGARQVLLSNPSKLHLAATLYRQIDRPNFDYRDVDGTQRRSDFPYHYQVFIPPHGIGPIGCTKIFIAGGEASQTFVLQKTDYFLAAPSDVTDEARPFVGTIVGEDNGSHLINLHATKSIHVEVDRPGGAIRVDLSPQAVSAVTIDGGAEPAGPSEKGHPRRIHLTDVHF